MTPPPRRLREGSLQEGHHVMEHRTARAGSSHHPELEPPRRCASSPSDRVDERLAGERQVVGQGHGDVGQLRRGSLPSCRPTAYRAQGLHVPGGRRPARSEQAAFALAAELHDIPRQEIAKKPRPGGSPDPLHERDRRSARAAGPPGVSSVCSSRWISYARFSSSWTTCKGGNRSTRSGLEPASTRRPRGVARSSP